MKLFSSSLTESGSQLHTPGSGLGRPARSRSRAESRVSAAALLTLGALAAPLVGCSSQSTQDQGPGTITTAATDPRIDETFVGATPDQITAFNKGDAIFDLPFFPSDGLGPLYVAVSCGDCHNNGLRGPSSDARMVMVEADGFTTAADQSPIAYGNEIRSLMTAGATTPVVPPSIANVKVTTRLPPSIVGHGYMEAVMDSEIVRVAAEQAQRTDGIHGRINYVVYASETTADPAFNSNKKGDTVIGRFGLKARIPTLDDFASDAFQNDMGITSPMRPTEDPNPDGLTDDEKPGLDTTLDTINALATYMRLNAIPTRNTTPEGAALFDQAKCSVCHVPSLKTRADYPIAQLAGIDAAVYTDFLLHDMGSALADGMPDGTATSSEFRTPPLMAMTRARTFMSDGRAGSIDAAIRLHAGEGTAALQIYEQLSDQDRATLLSFVGAL